MKGLLSIVAFLLVVYALIDCVRADRSEVRTLPKPVWVVLILLLPVVGALAYLLTGRHRPGPAAPPERRRGPVAPDDVPDFLWRLEQERRRSQGQTGPDGPRRPGEDGAPTG